MMFMNFLEIYKYCFSEALEDGLLLLVFFFVNAVLNSCKSEMVRFLDQMPWKSKVSNKEW